MILLFFNIFYAINMSCATVTYELSGGRFGDNLLAYCHAKWISYKYNIPLLYKPFEYSDQLSMHYLKKTVNHNNIQNKTVLTNELNIDVKKKCVYVVPYFSEVKYEHTTNPQWIFFNVDWNDPKFKQQIQATISPVNIKQDNSKFPEGYITVALHIRTGSKFDDLPTINLFPLKFLSISFYVDQIKKIYELVNHANLYVYLFTDDTNPKKLISEIKSYIPNYKNIVFDFRKQGNVYNKNVVEDFFFMTKFDCLIRGQSNYSIIASKIANYKIEIFASDVYFENNQLVITTDSIKKNY